MLVIVCCLFVFLGMYIGDKYNLKSVSIYSVFGLFGINAFMSVLFASHYYLSINYHSSTMIYLILGCILGYTIMKIVCLRYDEADNLSIVGFSLFNSYLFVIRRFSFLFFLINILYYIIIGIYIRKSRSWIFVFIGMFIGILLGFVSSWILGYLFCIIFSFLLYFVISICGLIFKGRNELSFYFLAGGILIGIVGCLL